MTQRKIILYHRSTKNVVKLQNFNTPAELNQAITEFVEHCNHDRYHEPMDNLIPADIYFGRIEEVHFKSEKIKQETKHKGHRFHLQ